MPEVEVLGIVKQDPLDGPGRLVMRRGGCGWRRRCIDAGILGIAAVIVRPVDKFRAGISFGIVVRLSASAARSPSSS